MQTRTKIGTESIDGTKVDIYVDEDGDFLAEFDGSPYDAETKPKLLDKLRKARRAAQAPVPVTVLSEPDGWRNSDKPVVTHGLLTGLHGGHGAPLVSIETGKGMKRGWQPYASDIMRRLTPNEEKEYVRLFNEERKAREALEKFKKERHLDCKKVLAEAAGVEE